MYEARMLHTYTYSTSPEKVQFMEQSAKLHSLKVENLATKTTWSGWQDRIDAISAKLETLPDTDIFCFIDAYDLIVNADEKTVLEQFREMKAPLIFGAETILFPFKLQEKQSEYPASPTPFRFLNGGMFIGYVKNLKDLYAWGKQNYPQPVDDDQGFYQAFFLKNPGAITLDHSAKLVINMNQVPWQTLQIVSGRVEFMPFQVVSSLGSENVHAVESTTGAAPPLELPPPEDPAATPPPTAAAPANNINTTKNGIIYKI